MRVIEHRKPVKAPKAEKPYKVKRYRVEYFSYNEDEWIARSQHRFAWSAKIEARLQESNSDEATVRVVDTKY